MPRFASIAVFTLALLTTPVLAHSALKQSDPIAGSSLKAAPPSVSLTFSQKLEGAFSSIRVFNAMGVRVDDGKAHVDPNNPTVLRVGLKPLTPGSYKVQWRALSVDTHTTEGAFSFKVEP